MRRVGLVWCLVLFTRILAVPRGHVERAVELYDQAVQFSRSELEMGQALVAREVLSAHAGPHHKSHEPAANAMMEHRNMKTILDINNIIVLSLHPFLTPVD
jgi:hypothetical protein